MSQAAPLEESVELFNRLAALSLHDTSEIGRIQWRLRALLSAQPGNVRATVALIKTNLMLGQAADACALAEDVFQSRRALDPQAAGTLAGQLLNLGMYKEFLITADESFRPLGRTQETEKATLYAQAFWGLGRFEEVERSIGNLAGSSWPAVREAWLDRMRASNLNRYFEDHQRIVSSHARGWQVLAITSIMGDSEGDVEATTFLYGGGTYAERREREDAVAADLQGFYEGRGASGLPFDRLLNTTFLPLLAIPEPIRSPAAADA